MKKLFFLLFLVACGGSSSPPPKPATCPWDFTKTVDDPDCVEPLPSPPPVTCDHTLQWINPTEDINNNPLPEGSLTKATIYVGMIPMAPEEELEFIVGVDAYIVMWTIADQPEGLWYYRLTVSNEYGESDFSNEASATCP